MCKTILMTSKNMVFTNSSLVMYDFWSLILDKVCREFYSVLYHGKTSFLAITILSKRSQYIFKAYFLYRLFLTYWTLVNTTVVY